MLVHLAFSWEAIPPEARGPGSPWDLRSPESVQGFSAAHSPEARGHGSPADLRSPESVQGFSAAHSPEACGHGSPAELPVLEAFLTPTASGHARALASPVYPCASAGPDPKPARPRWRLGALQRPAGRTRKRRCVGPSGSAAPKSFKALNGAMQKRRDEKHARAQAKAEARAAAKAAALPMERTELAGYHPHHGRRFLGEGNSSAS